MFRKANTLLFFVALLANLVFGQRAESQTQSGKIWAVVVGISKYQKLPGGQQLQFADKDATLFADTIQRRGAGTYNVRLLTGSEATVSAVKSAIGTWLAHSASPNDTVIIFFSGHGYFEKEFGESYLLCSDSDVKDPFATGLAIGELRQALTRLRANRVLVLADPIRRDFFDPDVDPSAARSFLQAFEQMSTARHGLSAIVANGAGEFSREGQRWGGHGVFAKHLADVLSEGGDRNGDGILSGDEIFDALASRVSSDTSNKQHVLKAGAPLDQLAVSRLDRQIQATAPATKPSTESAQTPNTATQPAQVQPTPPTKDQQATLEPPKKANDNQQPSNPPAAKPTTGAAQTQQSTTASKSPTSAAKTQQPNNAPKNSDTIRTAPPRDKNTRRDTLAVNAPTPETQPAIKPVEISRPEGSSSAKPSVSSAEAAGETRSERSNNKSTVNNESTEPTTKPSTPAPAATPPVNTGPRPPSTSTVEASAASDRSVAISDTAPVRKTEAAPSPLVLQIEVALNSKRLIEPRNSSAWDLFQRLVSESSASSEVARLKPMLAAAFIEEGKTVVTGDVRGDNIADQVDSFKRAGQLLARARSLAPERADTAILEKLSAAEALISLQFYDEAERALGSLQDSKLAAVDNALGLVYHGKFDSWRAERAFKRASDLDSKWATPHYNLALLYRSQQNQDSLGEFERAAALAPDNVAMVAALGEEYFTRLQFKEASEAYRKAVLLKPTDDTLHTKLGHALYSLGLQEEANREYQKAKELRSKQL